MCKFIAELKVVPSIAEPISIYCDNNEAIAQAKEPRSHQWYKHVLRRYHLIREIVARNDVKIERVSIDDNVADPLMRCSTRANSSTIWSQWILDTWVIASRLSGRLLGICHRAIVVITIIHVDVIFKLLIKASLHYIVLCLITRICKS